MRTAGLGVVGAVALALFAVPQQAEAASVDESASKTKFSGSSPYDPFDLEINSLPAPASDVTVTFEIFGDFNASSEWVEIDLEGFGFGRWLDEDTGNDPFSSPSGDDGNQYTSTITGTTTVPQATFASIVSDGKAVFSYTFGPGTDDLQDDPEEFASARVQYTSTDSTVIPTPSTAAAGLLLFGVAGFSRAGRRRNA